MAWRGLIEEYRTFLPLQPTTKSITLLEGNTPLVKAEKLSEELGLEVYLKFEGANPTGSFKDRGMTMAVTKALEEGSRAVICASTGNTAASAAAYGARAGLKVVVLISSGNTALGKLAQALTYGAQVIAIDGNFDRALEIVREISADYPITLVNSVNPYRIEGQKTAAFEICDVLGDAPDYLAIPVGNAGNITAYWQGFREYYAAGKSTRLPKMIGFEAEGAAAIVQGKVIPNPETIATAIRIGNPASWEKAVAAAKDSGGFIDFVTDQEILDMYKKVASEEGVFCEPASAASLAGLYKKAKAGLIPSGSTVAAVLTGHGLKDPNIAIKLSGEPVVIKAEMDAVLKSIGF